MKNMTGFFYFSDHSENVLHHAGHDPSFFSFDMIRIPMFAWFSRYYRNKYPVLYANLKRHSVSIFTNDLIFDTVIGMTNIKTDANQKKFDLSSPLYRLKKEEALTLHGKLHITDQSSITR